MIAVFKVYKVIPYSLRMLFNIHIYIFYYVRFKNRTDVREEDAFNIIRNLFLKRFRKPVFSHKNTIWFR